MNDPYVNAKSGILKNKFNIDNEEKLKEIESNFTVIRIKELDTTPINGNFDFEHLCKVHEYIFQDVYEWAGQPRVIEIEKSEPVLGGISIEYEKPHSIKISAEQILKDMKSIAWNKLSLDEKAVLFSKSMAELWKVHSFREGNTRTTITFCCDFAEKQGIHLDKEIFKENSKYIRTALVAASAKFSDLGDLSQPEHLIQVVKDSMFKGEKEHQNKQEVEEMSMSEWKSEIAKRNSRSNNKQLTENRDDKVR